MTTTTTTSTSTPLQRRTGCTWTGFLMILRGRVADHRRWMIRSFSLVFGGVTLRLILGTYSPVEGAVNTWLPFHTVYTRPPGSAGFRTFCSPCGSPAATPRPTTNKGI